MDAVRTTLMIINTHDTASASYPYREEPGSSLIPYWSISGGTLYSHLEKWQWNTPDALGLTAIYCRGAIFYLDNYCFLFLALSAYSGLESGICTLNPLHHRLGLYQGLFYRFRLLHNQSEVSRLQVFLTINLAFHQHITWLKSPRISHHILYKGRAQTLLEFASVSRYQSEVEHPDIITNSYTFIYQIPWSSYCLSRSS